MKNIRSFVLGALLSAVLFLSFSVKADDNPKIVGDSGHLVGIEVFSDKGEALCIGPHYDKADKSITCD